MANPALTSHHLAGMRNGKPGASAWGMVAGWEVIAGRHISVIDALKLAPISLPSTTHGRGVPSRVMRSH